MTRRSPHGPLSDAAPRQQTIPFEETTDSELRTIRNRSSTLRIIEDIESSRVPDARPADRPEADKEQNNLPPSRVDASSDTIAVSKNNELSKSPEKMGSPSVCRKLGPETVFRLSGLPINHNGSYFDEVQTKAVIGRAFNVDETGIFVDSLANIPSSPCQTATIRFLNVPLEVERKINSDGELSVICRAAENTTERLDLTLDVHFESFTPLYSPRNTDLDVIALPGLGGHPFGSFKARGKDYMWLRDGLPKSLPSARVHIYGYDSHLQNSDSFQNLQDLGLKFAHALITLRKNCQKERTGSRMFALIGQSLGGLVIKEALCHLFDHPDSHDEDFAFKYVTAVFFFGTPNSGMDISSLVPMVTGQPNEPFLRSIGRDSAVLEELSKRWDKTTTTDRNCWPKFSIYSFYETKVSPTAAKVNGQWKMIGPPVALVDKNSAIHARPREARDNNIHVPIDSTHSDMAKFKSSHDGAYRDNVVPWLRNIVDRKKTRRIEVIQWGLSSISTNLERRGY